MCIGISCFLLFVSCLVIQPEDKVAEEAEKLVARLEAKVKSGEELSVCERVVLSSNEVIWHISDTSTV